MSNTTNPDAKFYRLFPALTLYSKDWDRNGPRFMQGLRGTGRVRIEVSGNNEGKIVYVFTHEDGAGGSFSSTGLTLAEAELYLTRTIAQGYREMTYTEAFGDK